MKGHRPVFWSQGLFLHPQHFQAADAATVDRIDMLRRHGLPSFWGIRKLQFSEATVDHAISIKRLEAVFPSGAAINVPFDTALEPLAMGSDWPAPDKPGTLYLGLALPRSDGANASPESATGFGGKRFVYPENPPHLPDMYGSAPPAPVHLLKYAPVLLRDVDLELYPNFECLPVAVLRRLGGHIETDSAFLPPLLSVDASPQLISMIRACLDTALSCAGRLAGYKTSVSADAPDMRFVLNFSALGILNRAIPALEHLLSSPHVHPWQMYGLLRVFAGELSTFYEDMDCLGRTSGNVEGIPAYTHENPAACFTPLCELLAKLLNHLGVDESKTLQLLPEPPYFVNELPDSYISPSCRYWLWISANALPEHLAEAFPRFAKLGAKDRLNLIIAKAVSGVPLTRSPVAPPGFLKRSNAAWYAIDTAHPLWQNIIEQKKICLFWEGSPEGADVRLVVTGR